MKKFKYINTDGQSEGESEAFEVSDYVSEAGTPNAPIKTDSMGNIPGSSAMRFSIKKIVVGETITIPTNSEMLLNTYIIIEGVLNLQGELSII